MTSIRHFLLAGLLSALFLVNFLAGVFGYIESRHEVEELFDAQLVQYARSLSQLKETWPQRPEPIVISFDAAPDHWGDEEAQPFGHQYEAKLFFAITNKEQQMLAYSDSIPDLPLNALQPGYSNEFLDGQEWRLFTLYEDNHWVITAQRSDIRTEMGQQIALQGIIPVIIGLPLFALLIWWIVGRGLNPVDRLAKELSCRAANDLSPL